MPTYLNPNSILDNSITKTKLADEFQTEINGKQATLVSGTNIKTINGQSILGEGNIEIEGGGATYTAGDNIDITNNVISVTGVATTSQLEAHTGDADIHVKPSQKTSWDQKYYKDPNGIPKTDLASAVQTSLGLADTALQTHQSIKTVNGNTITGTGNVSVGTVTSVGVSVPTGLSVSGSPVTTSGTVAISYASGYSIPTTAKQSSWDAKYDKPSTGIPKTDLASSVQISLGLADSALQSHQSIKTVNNNTITGTGNVSVGTVTSVGITPGTGISVSGSPVTTSGNITVSLPTTIIGSTRVTSISSIPVTHRAVFANISANGALSFASLPAEGFEVHVIIKNSGSSTISVTLPSSNSYVCTSETTIYISPNKFGEVNVVSINNGMGVFGYVRGISSI